MVRRSLIRWLLGGGFLGSAASFLYPAIRFIFPPEVPEAAVDEVIAGKIADFKPNTGKIIKFGSSPALVVCTGEGEFRAFSAVCTHLSCTVQFENARRQIWCACHNGFYDLNGKVVSGPPPAPLQQFQARIRGDELVLTRRG